MIKPQFFDILHNQFNLEVPFLSGSGDPQLTKMRREALNRAMTLNIPNNKMPNWRFSKLAHLLSTSPNLQHRKNNFESVKDFIAHPEIEGDYFIFINGFYFPQWSQHNQKSNLCIKHFRPLAKNQALFVEELLAENRKDDHFLRLLNSALVNDGAIFIIPENYNSNRPLIIQHYLIDKGNHQYWISPQIHFHFENKAKATIIEQVFCISKHDSYINSQTNIKLYPNAHCDYFRHDKGNSHSEIFSCINTQQNAHSTLNLHILTEKGRYHRMEVDNQMVDSHAEYTLQGLMLPEHQTHHDWSLHLSHKTPKSTSTQVIKSIIQNEGHASFLGNVTVDPHSYQTLANMENYHLLLSENGQADSSPQLQILCDDLKCNHRSSTEQLNEIAMFYLTSRGIPRNVASRLLIEAYVSNFLESITQDKIKQFYQKNIFAFINSIYQEIKYERQF